MKRLQLIALVLFFTKTVPAQNYFIAHRGASYLAPENTLVAVNMAWDLGADAVEVDVHLSFDNRVMVIHDKNTKRTSKGSHKMNVAESSSAELRSLDVGSFKSAEFAGEKIPFIDEVLETIPADKTLFIEIKCGPEILPALEKEILQSGKIKQLVFISFGWNTILETQAKFPDNQCYYLKMNPIGLRRKMKQAAENKLAGVNLYYRIINPRVISSAEQLNIEVLTWTVDKPQTVRKLNNMGINKITTNRPLWLKEQLEK